MIDQKPVPAAEATVRFGAGVSVDGYMMPDSSFRYGLEYISVLLGYSRNYYRRLTNIGGTKKIPKKLRSLWDRGFTGYQIPVITSREGKGGAFSTGTLSFDDFCLIVEYEAQIKNPKAIALLTASFRELLRSRTQVAFGLPQDSVEQSWRDFEADYQAYLEREEALADNRSDVIRLRLPGDDLYYPKHQDWDHESDFYWECWESA